MGLRIFSGSVCFDDSHAEGSPEKACRRVRRKVMGNPEPSRFEIIRHEEVGRFAIVMVHYPDCTNYEGMKILVFENVPSGTIEKLDSIDPHFCDSKTHPSPIARFVPTKRGWDLAVLFAKNA